MSERIFSRFISGTFAISIGRFSTVAIGLLSFVITTRFLTPEELGSFILLQVIVSFFSSLSDVGLSMAITKFIAGTDAENEKISIINTILYFQCLMLILMSALALGGEQLLNKLFGSSLPTGLVIYIPILLVLDNLSGFFNSLFQGLFKFKRAAVIEILSSIVTLISILILVGWFKQGLIGRMYALLASKVFTLVTLFIVARIPLRLKFDVNILRRVLVFGFPLYIDMLLAFVFSRAGTFLIGAFLGPTEIALYEIARKIPDSLQMLYDAFRQVYYPFIARLYANNQLDKVINMLNTSNRLIAFLGLLGSIVTFALGDKIIILLFSAKYLDSVPIFAVLMIGLTLVGIDSTLGFTLVAIGDTNKPPLINSIRALTSFAAYFLLIPSLGIMGAALANLIAIAFVNPLNVFFLRRKRIVAQIMVYLKPFLIFGACLALFFLIKPACILLQISFFLLFLITNVWFSVITIEDAKILLRETRVIISKYVGLFNSKAV